MICRIRQGVGCLAVCAAAACAGSGAPAADAEPPPGVGPAAYAVSHHGVVSGTVTDAAGAPLDSIEVVTWRLASPGGGSLANQYGLTDRRGAVSLPVQLTAPSGTTPDTFTVRVVVRGYAFSPRHNCGGEPLVDSTVVPVRLVLADRTPSPATLRLVLPVRRC